MVFKSLKIKKRITGQGVIIVGTPDFVEGRKLPVDEKAITPGSPKKSEHSKEIPPRKVKRMEWMDFGIPALYVGTINGSDQPHGFGSSTMNNGHTFVGTFSEGKKVHGTWMQQNGDRYKGDFHENCFHGRGRFTWKADKSYYTGNWEHGNHHGYGKLKEAACTYCGDFRQGKRHGHGKLTDSNGNVVYVGEFRNGQTVDPEDQDEAVIDKVTDCLDGDGDSSPRVVYGLDDRALELNCSECASQLTLLPPDIGKLFELRVLDLSGCDRLEEIPPEIGKLENLKRFRLQGCTGLQKLPQEIGRLAQLVELNLTDCKNLKILPQGIGRLSKLTILVLSGCENLRKLPREIGQLSKLTMLVLGGCDRLRPIPQPIRDLATRNNFYLPLRFNGDNTSPKRAFLGFPTDRFEWSGPGGMDEAKKKGKDEKLISLAVHRMQPITSGGVLADIVGNRRNTPAADRETAPRTFDEVRSMLDRNAHRCRWSRQQDTINDAYEVQHYDIVEKKVTEHLDDISSTLREMECHTSGYYPTSETCAYYCRAHSRAKSKKYQGAVDDATECLHRVQTELRDENGSKQKRHVRPAMRVLMLRTRGMCLEKLNRFEEAIEDRRACCAAIRLAGDSWTNEPSLKDAVKELLHVLTVFLSRKRMPRPHYTREKRGKIERELGIGVFEESKHRCHQCGVTPSDSHKLLCCTACYDAWYCSSKCQNLDWKEGHKKTCVKVKKQVNFISLPHGKRPYLEQEVEKNECAIEVFDGTVLCILQDPTTRRYFDSLSDKDISFKTDLQTEPRNGHRELIGLERNTFISEPARVMERKRLRGLCFFKN